MTDAPIDPSMPVHFEYAPLAAPQFPIVPMPKRNAIVDILVVVAVLGGFSVFTLLTKFQSQLTQFVPSGGLYLWVLINGILALLTVGVVLKVRGQGINSIGLRPPPLKILLLGVLAAVPACYLVGMVCSLAGIMIKFISTWATSTSIGKFGQNIMDTAQERTSFLAYIANVPLSWVVPVVLFVGFYEEIVFRGFLLPRLFALLPGAALPIATASVIFGLVHFTQGPVFMFQTAGVGLVLAIVALRTHSLWPGIMTHATIDGVSLFISIVLLPQIEQLLKTATSAPSSMPN